MKKYRKGVFVVAYSLKPLQYLLLHRKLHWQGWEFTKGGMFAREKPEHAVAREIKEETGLRAIKITKFNKNGSFIYDKKTARERKAKSFSYKLFSCEVRKAKVKVAKEHDGYRWLSYSEAMKLLRWQSQRSCLKIVNKFINKRALKKL